MAPDPSDPFVFASIRLLLHKSKQQNEIRSRSFDLHKIGPLSSSSTASRNSRCHRKHRSRRHKLSKLPLHYLKPGALAQIRDAQKSAARSFSACCTKKRLLDSKDACKQANMVVDSALVPGYDEVGRRERVGVWTEQATIPGTSMTSLNPVTRVLGAIRVLGPLCPQRKKLWAFKTPHRLIAGPAVPVVPASAPTLPTDSNNESHLELLPLDLLVRIVCNLHHDQLKPAFHVSRRLRQAVLIARQSHFDFVTPDREQDVSHLNSKGPAENMPFSRTNAGGSSRQATPRAPRQAQKPLQARVPVDEMQQVAGHLFRGRGDGPHHMKPVYRQVASHRVLF